MTGSRAVIVGLALLGAVTWVVVRSGMLPSPTALVSSGDSDTDVRQAAEEFEWPERATRLLSGDVPAVETSDPRVLRVTVNERGVGPLAGVTVTCFAWNEGTLYATDIQAETGSSGAAELPVPPDGLIIQGPDGITLSAEKDGYATAVESFRWPGRDFDFLLTRSCAIYGRVLDLKTHAPICGARLIFGVVFEFAEAPYGESAKRSPVETVTDAEGRYRYEHVVPSQQAIITILREGYHMCQFIEQVGEGREHHADLYVPAGRSLTGRIFDGETGTPLEGVQIWRNTHIDTTDEHGRFQVRGLTDKMLALSFNRKEYCLAWLIWPENEFDEGEERRIPMFRSSTVVGTVLDAAGEPVADAPIEVETAGPFTAEEPLADRYPAYDWDFLTVHTSSDGSLATDLEGRFRVTGLKALSQPIRIHTLHPRFDSAVQSEWIHLSSFGETREIVLRHAVGAKVEGVIGPAGVPWRVAWVGSSMTGGADADVDGNYALQGVESGTVRVNVLWPGRSETDEFSPGRVLSSTTLSARAGEVYRHDIHMDVDPQAILTTGTVVGQDGAVRPGVPIEMYLPFQLSTGSSDDSGRFEIQARGEPGMPFRLLCGSPDTLQVELAAAVGDRDIDVVLPESASVRLEIIDEANGLPLRPESVSWTSQVGTKWRQVSGTSSWMPTNQGAGVVRLPIGRVAMTVEAASSGYLPTTVSDLMVVEPPGENAVTVRLRRTQ